MSDDILENVNREKRAVHYRASIFSKVFMFRVYFMNYSSNIKSTEDFDILITILNFEIKLSIKTISF